MLRTEVTFTRLGRHNHFLLVSRYSSPLQNAINVSEQGHVFSYPSYALKPPLSMLCFNTGKLSTGKFKYKAAVSLVKIKEALVKSKTASLVQITLGNDCYFNLRCDRKTALLCCILQN